MNDRFKFRVWDKKHNCYDFCRRKFGILYIQEKFRVSSGYDGEDQPTFCEDVNDNYIIEQCTGLKDKNGNLIFEGDRVGFYIYGQDEKWYGGEGTVIWYNSSWGIETSSRFICFENCIPMENPQGIEIIGNIHEQAEQKD